MSAPVMSAMLVLALGIFAWSVWGRWRLMRIGSSADRQGDVGARIRGLITFGFAQQRMRRYPLAGAAHMFIFLGFSVLLIRAIVLFGRGYDEGFNLFFFAPQTLIGQTYSFFKDLFVILVLIGSLVFLYYRLVTRKPRLTHTVEGVVILLIIVVLMISDLAYEGAGLALDAHRKQSAPQFLVCTPAGSTTSFAFADLSPGALRGIEHAAFWIHTSLIALFLNLLPYSKHFHIITALPNIFLRDNKPRGRLAPIADIEGRLEREETLGVANIRDFSWKSILDLYTCTECGRCSDHCPATKTGKKLSPKHFTVDLRNFLYSHEKELVGGNGEKAPDLVSATIDPEVLWACTSCRACETECPVFITYVDKIVDMRRHLVMEKAEFPAELQNVFQGLERDGNPWSFQSAERGAWAADLNISTMAELGDEQPEWLMWVGCAPSFDERAKSVSRATAQLLEHAGVKFAILGAEETCTGDPARRAGNEYLFQMLAETNSETLNGYKVRKIVTTCPHCFNTLKNEYGDFGGHYEVVHHSELLAELVRQKRIQPKNAVKARVVYHDSCYLGRYNDVYDGPREVLRRIPGVTLVEASENRDRGMCCGAGGAQMFKEEEPGAERVNHVRTEQLLATKPDVVSSGCPFCMRMLTDGLTDKERTDVRQLDVAEMLWESVSKSEPATEPEPSGKA